MHSILETSIHTGFENTTLSFLEASQSYFVLHWWLSALINDYYKMLAYVEQDLQSFMIYGPFALLASCVPSRFLICTARLATDES